MGGIHALHEPAMVITLPYYTEKHTMKIYVPLKRFYDHLKDGAEGAVLTAEKIQYHTYKGISAGLKAYRRAVSPTGGISDTLPSLRPFTHRQF